jgi:hypothetical protein
MKLISDESVRLWISKYLLSVQHSEGNVDGLTYDISMIDEFIDFLISDPSTIRGEIRQNLSRELSLFFLGLTTISTLALTVDSEADSVNSIISKDWLEIGKVPNPNHVIANLLFIFLKHTFAAIQLVELGLDPSARSITRIALELSWLTVLLSGNKEKMQIYVGQTDEQMEKTVFFKHFSGKKLMASLAKLEADLGVAEDISEEFTKIRDDTYSFYSKYVHSSYMAMMTGNFGIPFDNDEILKFSLFGFPSASLGNLVNRLNLGMFYLVGMLFEVFKQIHGLEISPSTAWGNLDLLRKCFMIAFQMDYIENNHH